MKVFLATAGEYSDYRVCHVFARREDAEAYVLGDSVEEREIREEPVEVRTWHVLWWQPSRPDHGPSTNDLGNPWDWSYRRDFDGRHGLAEHQWEKAAGGLRLRIEGWDHDRIMKVYREQRAQYEARQQGIAP